MQAAFFCEVSSAQHCPQPQAHEAAAGTGTLEPWWHGAAAGSSRTHPEQKTSGKAWEKHCDGAAFAHEGAFFPPRDVYDVGLTRREAAWQQRGIPSCPSSHLSVSPRESFSILAAGISSSALKKKKEGEVRWFN